MKSIFLWVKSCKFPHVSWYLLLKSRWHLHEGEPLATPPGREGFGVQVGPLAEISSSSCLISIWFWENYRFCLAILLIFFGNFVWNLLILLGSVGFLVNRNCSVQCISDLVLELVAVERSPLSAFKHCAVILVESWNVCDIHHWVISACKSQGLLFAVLPFLHVCWFGHPGVEQINSPIFVNYRLLLICNICCGLLVAPSLVVVKPPSVGEVKLPILRATPTICWLNPNLSHFRTLNITPRWFWVAIPPTCSTCWVMNLRHFTSPSIFVDSRTGRPRFTEASQNSQGSQGDRWKRHEGVIPAAKRERSQDERCGAGRTMVRSGETWETHGKNRKTIGQKELDSKVVLSCFPIEMHIQVSQIDWTSMLQDLDSFDERNSSYIKPCRHL